MNACMYWINKAKVITGMNDLQLSKTIGTSSGTLFDSKHGRTRIPPHASKKIAQIVGVPYPYVLASIASDQAKDDDEKAAWMALIPNDIAQAISGVNIV